MNSFFLALLLVSAAAAPIAKDPTASDLATQDKAVTMLKRKGGPRKPKGGMGHGGRRNFDDDDNNNDYDYSDDEYNDYRRNRIADIYQDMAKFYRTNKWIPSQARMARRPHRR